MNNIATLKKLGLGDKESSVYLALLKHGKMKPSEIANHLKISRPLIYSLSKSLMSKGLISEDKTGKNLHFVALPPAKLEHLIDDAKREIKEREKLVRGAIADLSLISTHKQYPIPKIRFVEEKDLEKFLFDNLHKWQDEVITSDGIWWGFQDNKFVEIFKEWISATWLSKQSKDPHYKAQVLTSASPAEYSLEKKYPKSKRDMRYVDQSNFTATTWVCGDYLVMIMTQEHPYYLLEIHDKLIARNTAEILKRLWDKK